MPDEGGDGGGGGGGGGTDNPGFNNDEETSCNNSTSTASFGKCESNGNNEVRIEVPEDKSPAKKNGELSFLNSSSVNANGTGNGNAVAQANNGSFFGFCFAMNKPDETLT